MSPITAGSLDDTKLNELWQPVASAVIDQLSDLLGARLVAGANSIIRGTWADLSTHFPASVTAIQGLLQGDCQGRCVFLWSVSDGGAPEQWLDNEDVRLGLWEAVTTGVTSGLAAGEGRNISLIPQTEPVTGTMTEPIGMSPEEQGVLLYWEATGDGVSFFLGVVLPESVVLLPDKAELPEETEPVFASIASQPSVSAGASRVQTRAPRLPIMQSNGGTKVRDLDIIMDLPLRLTVELGSSRMLIKEVLSLGKGSVVELNRLAGEPVDVLVNGKLLSRGEIVVLPDGNFGVRITEIINASDRLRNLQAK